MKPSDLAKIIADADRCINMLTEALEHALVCIADNPDFYAEERIIRAALHKAAEGW